MKKNLMSTDDQQPIQPSFKFNMNGNEEAMHVDENLNDSPMKLSKRKHDEDTLGGEFFFSS